MAMAAAQLSQTFLARPRTVRARAGARQVVVAAARPTWYPGATPAKWLDGSLPGDYGFDPLGLGGGSKETLGYFAGGELINGRWAMLAVAGILATDLLGKGNWWTAGAEVESQFDLKTLIIVEIVVFGLAEAARVQGWKSSGSPNGNFNVAGMDSPEMRVKEIKNGRLAMLAFLGFSSQAAVRGLGPIECLKLHLEDPAHNNIFTSAVGNEAVVAVCALAIAPFLVEVKNKFEGPDSDTFRAVPW